MPKVGMRIFKTFIAVYLCFLIYLLRGEQGSPFYSAIAAILCMQPYVSNSFKVAMNRTLGTFIGGAMGLGLLIFERSFIPVDMPMLQYLVVSLCVIPLIYFTVAIKKPTASYITCVVFLSITVTHGADVNPLIFTIDRIVDTLIGIFVSLGVNAFHLPRRRNRKTLFVTNLDGSLLNSQVEISSYSRIKLNTMIRQGALITIATTRSAETLLPLLEGVEIKVPVIMMNGAVWYDLQKRSYLSCKKMNPEVAKQLIDVFEKRELNCFTHTIINDVLHVYYTRLINPVEEKIYHSKKRLPEQSYVCGEVPNDQSVLSIMAVDQKATIVQVKAAIMKLEIASAVNVECYPDDQHPGYYFLEITSREASVKNAIMDMKARYATDKVIAFGNDIRNAAMLEAADFAYVVENASIELKEMGWPQIGANDDDAVVKTISRHFYAKPGSFK
ncbi:HAD hydrolase family protein [Acetobacterium wieringae]|uniref:Pyridoxal phosphate (PLP) phosphatase n=1 Tax=Acetobacterium wieringae TaxID=52694 RepID=A0A1F2PJU6_9FIRM|nr:HAD hydrolase family protein [Acetobacterium wieringae]OFV70986.1 pyridoxal phosphate (PLP) phosphatase [Acetobacterium wieringae]URN84129.1 HAD hydrolase family protein [Acetobacterium wieringae]